MIRTPCSSVRWIAIAAVLLSSALLTSQVVEGTASDRSDSVERVTAHDKTIVVHESGKEHEFDFDDDLGFSEIDSVRLLFQNRAKNELYLFMDVVGPSTGGGNGPCGAGQEEYLIWMALDAKWQKDDQKLELIASCFENIGGLNPDSYTIKHEKLVAEYIQYKEDSENVQNTLTYDSAEPAKGWTIQRKDYSSANQQ
jgi:hypothetical protein